MLPKKNWNKIPESLRNKISKLQSDRFMIGWYFEFQKKDLQKNLWAIHPEIPLDLKVWESYKFVPLITKWRYSKRNINGKENRRIDLPKIEKTYYLGERPNFWDWSKGSFDLYQTRMVTQKEFIPWQETAIEVNLLKTLDDKYIYRISVAEYLDKNFSDTELLHIINIAQENIWKFSIIDDFDKEDSYMSHLSVEWDIFPPWDKEDDLIRILSKYPPQKRTTELKQRIEERREFLLSLPSKNPTIISWGWWLEWYLGLKVTDEVVVFENMLYWNAVYILLKNWKELSKLPKSELLKRHEWEYERIVHNKNWQKKTRAILTMILSV